jgi:hypothetical protein
LDKCTFAQSELEFLGHRANANDIIPLSKNVQAIQEFSAPIEVKQLQRFLGFIILQTIHSWPSEVTTTSHGRLDRQPKDVGLDTADAPVL